MIKEAMLYERLEADRVHCFLCSHHCKISPSQFGICAVRKNEAGSLKTLVYAEAIAAAIDPIEKKPLYHFFPGSTSFSIATVGCNFRCGFCQNWQISQANKKKNGSLGYELIPEEVVRQAKSSGSKSISYTYTEPTIFFEYAFDTSQIAKKQGIYNNFVTNGYMTKEALETVYPFLDAANVDLKSFSEDFYKKICGARLAPVLDSIRLMRKFDIWVEITTLIVPGLNDSEDELKKIAEFIASVGIEIPWHVSRFHPDYKITDNKPTPIQTLRLAKSIGEAAGLRYVYMGNVFEGNNTYCYNCKGLLIERQGLSITKVLLQEGKCPTCKSTIDGVF
ncbi:MAG: AmmeMemoRadiSam system radical SAM enzyme [Candidatus Omnitrophota bacterium]